MKTDAKTPLKSCGLELDASPEAFGELVSSDPATESPARLRERLQEQGYLFLRGLVDPNLVLDARRSLLERARQKGVPLDPAYDLLDGRIDPMAEHSGWQPDLAQNNPELDRVVFGSQVREFYTAVLGGPVRHFDYKWLRLPGPGKGTYPHCDIVYMGRGTFDLFTAWIPYGRVPLRLGGLMILEDSHKKQDRIRRYLELDVDTYCTNIPGRHGYKHGGFLSKNPVTLREKLGGRWLTAEFQPGDVLTFGMGTIHASLDNHTENQVRISSDTRYQLAEDPIDERWIGENPIGHGEEARIGMIC